MTEMTAQERNSFKRKQTGYRIKRVSERIVSFSQVLIAVVGLIAVILLNISWLDGPFKKIGISDPTDFTGGVVAVIVVSIFFDVRSLIARKYEPEDRHFSDPMEVYPLLFERIRAISRPEEKVLDVIGITLYTAWPSIRFWLNRSDLIGWTVRFAAVAVNKRQFSSHMPEEWPHEAQANLNNVCSYANSRAVQAQHINLQAFGYDFMPSLHGYRLGNGDLFYSILLWRDDGKVSIDGYSYEFVPGDDKSSSAEAIRQVFDSWFKRATSTPWPAPAGQVMTPPDSSIK